MLVSDVVSRVRSAAGDTDALQFTDAQIYSWINDAVKECASTNQLLQKSATQTVVSGIGSYTLPTDILKLHSVKYDEGKLRIISLQQADEEFTLDTTTGTPVVGYIWANSINLYPIPDNSTKNLTLMYTQYPADITSGADSIGLPIMYHRRIVDYCLAMVAEQDDNHTLYQAKMQEFHTGVQILKDDPEWEQDLYPSISVSSRDMGDGYYDEGY